MLRGLDGLDGTTDVELFGLVVEVGGSRVGNVIGTKDLFGFEGFVGLVNVGDCRLAPRYKQI